VPFNHIHLKGNIRKVPFKKEDNHDFKLLMKNHSCTFVKVNKNTVASKHTISFFDTLSKQVISIQVAESSNLHPDTGYWNTATNQILLGKERFSEWNELTGHLERQIDFILKLEKVTRSLIA
jgi:hypothetical protein